MIRRLVPYDYLETSQIFTGDSEYLYGSQDTTNNRFVRVRLSDYTLTLGHLFEAGSTIKSVHKTDIPGEVFVSIEENSPNYGSLWRSIDYGDTFIEVLQLGDGAGTGGNPIEKMWLLREGLNVATVDGVRTYLAAEYQVNGSRVAGGVNDRIRIHSSVDGVNWSTLWEVNSDGSNNNIRHFHGVKEDPFNPGMVYIFTGDTDSQNMILQWDTSVGTFENNVNPTFFVGRDGFKVFLGAQRSRSVDLLFTKDYIFSMTDSIFVSEGSIWRFDRDFVVQKSVDRKYAEEDDDKTGWTAVASDTGNLYWISALSSTTVTNNYLSIYSSDDSGDTWTEVGRVHTVPGFGAASSGFVFLIDNRMYIGFTAVPGKKGSRKGTIVVQESEEPFLNYEAESVHPVYFIDVNGDDSNNGWSPRTPWKTISNLLDNTKITFGGCAFFGEGVFDCDGLTIDCTNSPDPGPPSSKFEIRGKGKNLTTLVQDSGVNDFCIGNDTTGVNIVIKDLTINTDVTGFKNFDSIVTNCDIYDCTIIADTGLNLLEGVTSIYRCLLDCSSSCVDINKAGLSFQAESSIILGGSSSVDMGFDSTVFINHCTLDNYSVSGVNIGATVTTNPTIINTAFVGSVTSIVDNASLTWGTEISYSYFSQDTSPSGIFDSVSSLSVGIPPLLSSDYVPLEGSPLTESGSSGIDRDFYTKWFKSKPTIGCSETSVRGRRSGERLLSVPRLGGNLDRPGLKGIRRSIEEGSYE